jgi:hypothetical protein
VQNSGATTNHETLHTNRNGLFTENHVIHGIVYFPRASLVLRFLRSIISVRLANLASLLSRGWAFDIMEGVVDLDRWCFLAPALEESCTGLDCLPFFLLCREAASVGVARASNRKSATSARNKKRVILACVDSTFLVFLRRQVCIQSVGLCTLVVQSGSVHAATSCFENYPTTTTLSRSWPIPCR